ncbi:MAG: sugar phosphate isomerase/epimerase [Bryobacteraceae bacterium]|nr:sugar phosphate isomerase/epimerase [Bryobacteraceae bacterium]
MLTRRGFLAAGAAVTLAAKKAPGLRIGVMDGVLKQSSRPEAVAAAKSFGVEGLQVTLGRPAEGKSRLPLDDAALQSSYLTEAKKHGIPLNATYIDILHVHCLKDDPLAPKLVQKGIDITRKLDAGILMTVFFGKCSVLNANELVYVSGLFKELAREAEKAGVILGFENLLSAEGNMRAVDLVGSEAFKIYYDVGNSTNRVGVDAPAEIRRMGKDRICQFHFKDEGYLGAGKVNFPAVLDAIHAIGFQGFANLETNSPSGSMENDLRRNLKYLEGLRG